MKAYRLTAAGSLGGLHLVIEDVPPLGSRDVLVRVRANSLNHRDLTVVRGHLINSAYARPIGLVPLSDGAGDIISVGDEVRRVRVGDKVVATFFPHWLGGAISAHKLSSIRGGTVDGMLREYAVLHEDEVVIFPPHLSYAEAATLPCAALTAWAAVQRPAPMKAGQSLLVQGSGGVSIFALQFGKLQGVRVAATTSSLSKVDQLKALGADLVIHVGSQPNWVDCVRDWSSGGVDRVVEVGGINSLAQSLSSLRLGGDISLLGYLASKANAVDLSILERQIATISRISVSSRDGFDAMNLAIGSHNLRPVIARTFGFLDARAAFTHLEAAGHIGKIVIDHDV